MRQLFSLLLAATAAIAVADEPVVSFRRDVMPVLFRAGCFSYLPSDYIIVFLVQENFLWGFIPC